MEKTLNVEGMMCQHCVAHVKRALEGVGRGRGRRRLDAGTATAKLAHDVPEDVLAAAIVEAGYEVAGPTVILSAGGVRRAAP
ncbi:MAG: heavy-metal-associated domain-containing protein [Eggerthella lenta]